MAKGKKKRKRAKCKCHDITSCTKYVASAYRSRRQLKKNLAHKKWADEYYRDVY